MFTRPAARAMTKAVSHPNVTLVHTAIPAQCHLRAPTWPRTTGSRPAKAAPANPAIDSAATTPKITPHTTTRSSGVTAGHPSPAAVRSQSVRASQQRSMTRTDCLTRIDVPASIQREHPATVTVGRCSRRATTPQSCALPAAGRRWCTRRELADRSCAVGVAGRRFVHPTGVGGMVVCTGRCWGAGSAPDRSRPTGRVQ